MPRWGRTDRLRIERARDRILGAIGTKEPIIPVVGEEAAGLRVTMQWRRPLSIAEVNQLAPTPDVRRREGRP